MQPVRPELKAIVTCDYVIAEKNTDKYSLIGMFDRIYIPDFPGVHFPICLYVAFTGAFGDYGVRVEFYDLMEDKVLGKASLPNPIHCRDRHSVNQVILRLPPTPFPHEGNYELRVYANDKVLGQKMLQVIKRS